MPSTDKQGRAYADIDQLVDGQTVYLDGGFPCHSPGPVVVRIDHKGAYFECEDGSHYLDGQLDDDGPHCVGVYLADPGQLNWTNQIDDEAA